MAGAIVVDERMATDIEGIWAAGDCVHTHHVLTPQPTYLPLGTTAQQTGPRRRHQRRRRRCPLRRLTRHPSRQDPRLVAARTGFGDTEATAAGYDPVSTTVEVDDHKAYYPGATTIHVRITGDRRDDRLLGAQLIGAYGAEISKRVDIIATAIHNHRTVASLSDLDLSYTPPLSSPWDPLQTAAQAWMRANRQ